jgi:uncharacterized protein (DUF4415 family)
LALFDAMTDDLIDTSEIPPLSEEFFEKATWRAPHKAVKVTIEVEPDILAWFKAQGDDYQQRLAAALRLYVEAHKSFAKEYQVG